MRAQFWRNVTLIALAHAALLFAVLHWANETKAATAPEITWLSGGADAEASQPELMPPSPTDAVTPETAKTSPPTKSEIVLPSASPSSTPTTSATPRSTPKLTPATPSPTAKPPRKKPRQKTTATPARKKSVAAATGAVRAKNAAAANAKKSTGGSGEGASGTGSGKSDAATANYYGNMLHDRFYRAWNQPQTVVATGVKLSAVARIRIEKDGRISNFKIVKPSGNMLVDESVAAVAQKVTQVDALPAGMGSGGHYDLNIGFALNSE